MIRRTFLQTVLSFSGSLVAFPAALLARLNQNNLSSDDFITLINSLKGGEAQKLRFRRINKQIYISLIEFSTANGLHTFTNSARRKTVLYLDRDKAVFTADNGFVLLNDQLYHYPYEPVWMEGEIYVPTRVLARLFDEHSAHQMVFDEGRLEFIIGRKDVNIANIQITEKENGTLIHILSHKQFSEKDVSFRVANDWLYVEIYGGKVETESISKRMTAGVVSEIQAVQFDQTVSLAFKLRKKIESRELILSPDSNDLFINLRTSQGISREDTSKEELQRQKQGWLVDTIVIDPGHGGKDPGAVGVGGLKEKDIVLPVALKLGQIIQRRLPDVNIVYTRDKDVFVPLWQRTKIANEKNGKLFISLHCNSNRSSRVNGFETYFLSSEKDEKARDVVLTENEVIKFESTIDQKRYEGINFVLATLAQNAFLKYSQYFASLVQKALGTKLIAEGMKDRGVKQGPFWVMVGATMPNILVELGFISNKYEAKLLKQTSVQTKMADAICDGIIKYKNDFENAL
jgi:N-acetylmuramoyl-L-alanine amidase